ncbi:MAG: hypothetical protein WBB19_04305 [Desulforhopalus sp.]
MGDFLVRIGSDDRQTPAIITVLPDHRKQSPVVSKNTDRQVIRGKWPPVLILVYLDRTGGMRITL